MNPSVLENILILHAQRYPAMEEQDYVKLLCQSELGPAHLLSSPEEALSALREATPRPTPWRPSAAACAGSI